MALRAPPQKYSEGNRQNVEISNSKTTTSTTHQLKIMQEFAFRDSETDIFEKYPPKMTKDTFAKKKETARAVSGPEGCICHVLLCSCAFHFFLFLFALLCSYMFILISFQNHFI